MIKTDITLLTIQTRGMVGLLYRQLLDGKLAAEPYRLFVELFFQLYLSFKYNAKYSKKIENWDEKEKMYDRLFYEDLVNGRIVVDKNGNRFRTKYFPNHLIRIFDGFVEDMRICGIYDLSHDEFIGKGGV